MADTRADEDRLPWLGPSGPSARRSIPSAGRRARTPLMVLLALFLFGGVGIISYLAGRGSVPAQMRDAPVPPLERSASRDTVTLPPAALPPPPVMPSVVRTAEAPRAAPPRPAAARRATPRPDRRVSRATAERRAVRPAPAAARRVAPSKPASAPVPRYVLASKVVQLGVYRNRRGAVVAYRRLVAVYPYLAKLPRTIRRTPDRPGAALSYRLQMRTYSPDHARLLCDRLRSIGRGCVVLPQAGQINRSPFVVSL